MSTRANVLIKGKLPGSYPGKDVEEFLLYHHTDGYPEYMLETFRKAWQMARDKWDCGCPEVVVSFLCAVDPGIYIPKQGLDLSPDIEYLYILNTVFPTNGNSKPYWRVTTRVINQDVDHLKDYPVRTFKYRPKTA